MPMDNRKLETVPLGGLPESRDQALSPVTLILLHSALHNELFHALPEYTFPGLRPPNPMVQAMTWALSLRPTSALQWVTSSPSSASPAQQSGHFISTRS